MVEQRVRFAGVVMAACAVLAVGCRGGGEESTPVPPTAAATLAASPTAVTPTPTPTVSLEAQREEVREAYLAYWDAYAAAVLELDVSLVEGFAAGDELEGIRQEIEQLRTDGVAARIQVDHDFEVASMTEDSAIVVDEYTNNSFYVDPVTKQPEVGEGSGEVVTDTVFMEKVSGRWVVVSGAREAAD